MHETFRRDETWLKNALDAHWRAEGLSGEESARQMQLLVDFATLLYDGVGDRPLFEPPTMGFGKMVVRKLLLVLHAPGGAFAEGSATPVLPEPVAEVSPSQGQASVESEGEEGTREATEA